MKIIGGQYRGRKLMAPAGLSTRPTSARVRESLFNILAHSIADFSLAGARVIDLFCGSGALGLEALSRGADFALLIDNDRRAGEAAQGNIATLGLEEKAVFKYGDALKLGRNRSSEPFNLVFLDPPYNQGLAGMALAGLADGGWLEDGAIGVVEESARAGLVLPSRFALLDQRIYGAACLSFLRFEAAS